MKKIYIVFAAFAALLLVLALLLGLISARKSFLEFYESRGSARTVSAYPQGEAQEKASPIILSPSAEPSPSPSPTPAPTPTPTPAQSVLLDIPSLNQVELGYPLGCEMVSLAMMISYTTEVSLEDIYAELPRGENPNDGFRGDPASSNYGWTIFPKALTSLTEKYLDDALDMSGCKPEDLKDKLRANKPVMVWVVGLGWPVHCICLSGFDEYGFYYNDPANGEKDVFISYDSFYEIWTKQIYDKKLGISYPASIAMSY